MLLKLVCCQALVGSDIKYVSISIINVAVSNPNRFVHFV